MTKAELVRKIAKIVGVSDSDAKIFFELFLTKIAHIANPGDAIHLKGVGIFEVKKGKINKRRQEYPDEINEVIYTEIVQYSSEPNMSEEDKFLFNIPAVRTENYYPIDSHFSLSFGKPVIPVGSAKSTEYFIPPTGNELLKLIDTKVDKLITNATVLQNYSKGNEILVFDSFRKDENQLEFMLDKKSTKRKSVPSSKGVIIKSAGDEIKEQRKVENLPWDFGEELSKQIAEEALLDIEREENEITEDEDSYSSFAWDFGKFSEGETEDVESSQLGKAIKEAEKSLQEIDEEKYIPEPKKKTDAEEDFIEEKESETNFKRVKSITSEFIAPLEDEQTEEEELQNWDFDSGEIEETLEKDLEAEITPTSFEDDIEKKTALSKDFSLSGEFESEEEKQKESVEEIIEREFRKRTQTLEESYRKRSSAARFFVVLGTVLVIVIGWLLYNWLNTMLSKKEPESSSLKASILRTPVVINRNYEIPVTYPYLPNMGNLITYDPIDPAVFKTKITAVDTTALSQGPDQKKETVRKVPEPKETKPIVTELKPAVDLERVKDNIYKSGDTFVVQVSSWQSQAKAAAEVERLKRQGLSAFIQRAEIPGRGTWYRVRVGGFSSVADAEKFVNK
jgi:cell division septation protein DedD/nucleoid DNA-binding protein